MGMLDWIRSLLTRATLENPQTSITDPDAWLGEALGGNRTTSGLSVNRRKALGYAAVWRAVNLITGDISRVPVHVWRRVGEGKERAPEHPASVLLRKRPNEFMTAAYWFKVLQSHVLLEGNAYALIERTRGGEPVNLLPLDPVQTTPQRVDGVLGYHHRLRSGEDRVFAPEDIVHVKGLGFDGLVGYNAIQIMAESLGLGLAAREYGSRFFKQSATPKGVLEHPGQLGEEAANTLRKQWEKMHAGLSNAYKTAVLEEGMSFKPLSVDAKNSQLNETRQFEIREVASWFGVPPHKLGDPTRTAFASLEQENQSYLDEALDPWMVQWEQELETKLLSDRQRQDDSHVIEFLRQALIRANHADRASFYSTAIQNGWMSRDEVRARENLSPIPAGVGAVFLEPLNMQPAGAGDEPDAGDDQGDDDRDDRAARAIPGDPEALELHLCHLVRDAAARAVRRVAGKGARAARKADALEAWLRTLPSQREAVEAILVGPVHAVGVFRDGGPMAAEVADRLLALVGERFREMSEPDCLEAAQRGNLADETIERLAAEVASLQPQETTA